MLRDPFTFRHVPSAMRGIGSELHSSSARSARRRVLVRRRRPNKTAQRSYRYALLDVLTEDVYDEATLK